MEILLRLSTSPPNEWEGDPQDASYYCDLHKIEKWKEHPLLDAADESFRNEALQRGIAAFQVVATHGEKHGIGLLVCVGDDREGVMYLGIDLEGHACREPAANEALWRAANFAKGIAKDGR